MKPTADLPEVQHEAQVISHKFLSLRVCVPKAWTTEEIRVFANMEVLCGTVNGWVPVTEEGGRGPIDCADRKGFRHVICDA